MKAFRHHTYILILTLLFTGATTQAGVLDDAVQSWHTQPYSWQNITTTAAQVSTNKPLYLLKWKDSQQDPPPPPVEYDRLFHFGGWLSIKDDRSCLDVRNRVLIRDSKKEVELKPNNPCKILSGHWEDPYTGLTLNNPAEVDVDHMVPLKNAYNNGAWTWGQDLRCLYANYVSFPDHLKVVQRRENILKSDKDPSQYMPRNQAHRCQYLKDWLTIKLIWRLALRIDEAKAIRYWVQKERCNPEEFVFSSAALRDQRKKIQALVGICAFRNQKRL